MHILAVGELSPSSGPGMDPSVAKLATAYKH